MELRRAARAALAGAFLAGGALAGATTVAGPIPPGWERFSDERAGYAVCYPRAFTPERRSANAIILTSPEGATIRITSGVGGSGEEPKIAQARQRVSLSEGGALIETETSGPDWFALSGTRGSQGFYLRTTDRGGRAVSFTLEYPVRLQRRWQQVAGTIGNCLEVQPLPAE